MSDELNPYPGNLKQHKVEPLIPDDPYLTELRKAIEPMEGEMDTAKQFLLLAGERDALLAARAKDAELIQLLVDELAILRGIFKLAAGYETRCGDDALAAAFAAGFKPTNP